MTTTLLYAAICKRGHVVDDRIGMRSAQSRSVVWSPDMGTAPRRTVHVHEPDIPAHCPTCGAMVLTACESCETRIPGSKSGRPGDYQRPSFCACAAPFPWASDQEMLWHLQNLLDHEDINPAQRRQLSTELDRLQNEILTEKDERAIWTKIRTVAPAFLANPITQKIVVELVADPLTRKAIGL